MTHACCPGCRVRFDRAVAAYVVSCPQCGDPVEKDVRREEMMGFKLIGQEDLAQELPEALAVELPAPEIDAPF